MTKYFETIITGILATLIYEMIKNVFLFVKSHREEKNSTFNVAGYWCSYHKENSTSRDMVYESYELVYLKYKRRELLMTIYQVTNDGRKYKYKGKGIARYDKIIIPYEERTKCKSDFLGVIMVRFSNIVEHNVVLEGSYFEFRKNSMRAKGYPYMLKEFDIKFFDRIKLSLFGKYFAYKLINDMEYKDVCEKEM